MKLHIRGASAGRGPAIPAAGSVLALCAVLCAFGSVAQEPPLPPGLDAPEASAGPDEPALPPGLDSGTDEPALPPGIDSDAGAPALPPGLGLPEEEAPSALAEADEPAPRLRLPFHGFWDVRGGLRTQNDPAQSRDATLGEARLQLKTEHAWEHAVFEFTGDAVADAVLEEVDLDIRRFRLNLRPLSWVDVRVGRQVLTWGTGDMLFINDLFPKDWPSFFSGRDTEYLKAPSDSIRVGIFHDIANVDLVYTPRFAPDRFITGKRISYYDPLRQQTSGRDNQVRYDQPKSWFTNDEIAVRIYRQLGGVEAALYGYSGYWKSPGGNSLRTLKATFPRLDVYGASVRGRLGRGIANAEIGYYDSRDDRKGRNPFINNSEFRLLLGYEQELGRELTGAVQYYLEHMRNHGRYRSRLPFFMEPRDKNRHVLTLRLTKLLMNQNLVLSGFVYWSPSDQDAYFRPRVTYKITDQWMAEAGANIFVGSSNKSFFGQFEDNTNVHAGLRFSF